eukprot:PhM_4_TR1752/c0_g1_i1/m.98417
MALNHQITIIICIFFIFSEIAQHVRQMQEERQMQENHLSKNASVAIVVVWPETMSSTKSPPSPTTSSPPPVLDRPTLRIRFLSEMERNERRHRHAASWKGTADDGEYVWSEADDDVLLDATFPKRADDDNGDDEADGEGPEREVLVERNAKGTDIFIAGLRCFIPRCSGSAVKNLKHTRLPVYPPGQIFVPPSVDVLILPHTCPSSLPQHAGYYLRPFPRRIIYPHPSQAQSPETIRAMLVCYDPAAARRAVSMQGRRRRRGDTVGYSSAQCVLSRASEPNDEATKPLLPRTVAEIVRSIPLLAIE